ncbi:glycosyltransferase family 2 protein [Patescibacteria group bacterium]|nr:glycosyltransferase family 2 protein [Patescibacteria group bacterium]
MKRFSVVIPAYNAGPAIERTVRSAVNQQRTISRDDFEVIVVDNNSKDQTAHFAELGGADKVVKEFQKGTNFARNRGYLESQGEIVCFLDADCIAPDDWLWKIGRVFNDLKVQACGGPYDYGFHGLKAAADVVYTRAVFPFVIGLLSIIKGTAILIGGNFAVRRSAIEKIGGIPLVTYWGDDALVATLVRRMVGKVRFVSNLNVKSSHDRFDDKGFFRLAIGYARAFFRVWKGVPRHPKREDIPGIIERIFKAPLNK